MDIILFMNLYVLTFLCAAAVTALGLPLLKRTLGRFLTDQPGGLKTHSRPALLLGGCAVLAGTISALVLIRLITDFPTGTLHSLRGILGAGCLIFLLGLLDDLRKPKGLPIWLRLLVQAIAAGLLINYEVYVQIFQTTWLNYAFTFLWLVGLTNAFNLLDIADGLCTSQTVICTLGLFAIALPGELWYVNFAALALLGSCLACWPHNYKTPKIFLGDGGSTFFGFFIAALSMGTQYSRHNPYGYAAALFIVAVPLLDTTFVILARALQGKNPLKGSNDHLALQLKNKYHFKNHTVILLFALAAIGCNLLAYTLTKTTPAHTLALCVLAVLGAGMFILWLLQKLNTFKHSS